MSSEKHRYSIKSHLCFQSYKATHAVQKTIYEIINTIKFYNRILQSVHISPNCQMDALQPWPTVVGFVYAEYVMDTVYERFLLNFINET